MLIDFHYYATYCAAYLAGYSHEDSLELAYFDQFADCCTETLLKKLKGPMDAITTQYCAEMVNDSTDIIGLQRITRIWASFHFLPYDLYAKREGCGKAYLNRYRLICKPNGALVADTVNLAKDAGTLQAAGLAMHILADTWAHSNFAGVPSNVINNTRGSFHEIIKEGDNVSERKMTFLPGPVKDDPVTSHYSCSISRDSEYSVMNLGHGRVGHIPDFSYIRFRYFPAWNNYEYMVKDNPSDYYHAFIQMVYAMKYLRGEYDSFELDKYDEESVLPWKKDIMDVLESRQIDHCAQWKELASRISGHEIEDFDIAKYEQEYLDAPAGDFLTSHLGRFFASAIAQKSMVTHSIYESGNLLAGFSVDIGSRFPDISELKDIIEVMVGGKRHE